MASCQDHTQLQVEILKGPVACFVARYVEHTTAHAGADAGQSDQPEVKVEPPAELSVAAAKADVSQQSALKARKKKKKKNKKQDAAAGRTGMLDIITNMLLLASILIRESGQPVITAGQG